MEKKKTHEEYVNELFQKNPNIEVIGKYISTHTKITHRCKIDEYEWNASPANILRGRGCPKCSKRIKRTSVEYINEVFEVNPNIEVLGTYINNATPILHRCKIHNIKWYCSPSSILNGHSCRKCGNHKLSITKSKTLEKYVEDVKIKNPNIEVIGDYINAHTPILHRCLIDGFEWENKPNNILSGNGCPKCNGKIKKSHKQYVDEVSKINPDIKVLETYINAKTPILHICTKHNITWSAIPNNILNGCGCELCSNEKISDKNKMSHEQYIEKLNHINPNIIVLDTYINSHTPINHKCLICGNKWKTKPNSILFNKTGCPKCNESKGEREIRLWLDKHNIIYETQKSFDDCRDQRTLPFDFYLSEQNKIIEFDGEQHYKPISFFGGQPGFEKRQKHDIIKDNFCKSKGINLLRIPYNKNIEEELDNFLFN